MSWLGRSIIWRSFREPGPAASRLEGFEYGLRLLFVGEVPQAGQANHPAPGDQRLRGAGLGRRHRPVALPHHQAEWCCEMLEVGSQFVQRPVGHHVERPGDMARVAEELAVAADGFPRQP